MTEFTIPYGQTKRSVKLPDSCQATYVAPARIAAAPDPGHVVRQALEQPQGDRALADFKGVRSAAIAINDKTRPVPHHHLLPPLLQSLAEMGLAPEAITLIIATGAHPPMTPDEFGQVVPQDILSRYPVICHDAEAKASLVQLGQTSRGTPIWINRHFMEAELRLVVGNIEPHQFMGFSGGVKSAAIGLAGKETITYNHAMMTNAQAKLGHFDDNPVRQDVEEMGRRIGIHFALNAILNEQKQIVAAMAGKPTAVMQNGIPLVRAMVQVNVPALFDLMIASPGGHPKDINLYQTQKGLAHATLVTKPGGTIILAAACPEGTGSLKYERWVTRLNSHRAVLEQFTQEGYQVGPHKAFQISRDAADRQVILVSEMEPDFVRQLLLTPAQGIPEAIAEAVGRLPAEAHIGVMPWANATIPVLQQ